MKTSRFNKSLLVLSLLSITLLWVSGLGAVPAGTFPASVDDSDLNQDGIVDYNDIVAFSAKFAKKDASLINWCSFIDATELDEYLYGKAPKYYKKHFGVLLSFASEYFGCVERSDLNEDGRINIRDLMSFSEDFAGIHFMSVDWCAFLEGVLYGDTQFGKPADFYAENYGSLLTFIDDKYRCWEEPPEPPHVDPLAIKNTPKFLTRIAASSLTGDYYVTDARVGSVFIYDSNLVLRQELKGLASPLGIAVNADGHILVGNDRRDNVEVYDPFDGTLLATFGESEIETPTSILLDSGGNVFVSDTGSNTVYVYDNQYNLIRNIGERGRDEHQLRAPSNAWFSDDESELYVLDRLNKRVQIYEYDGSWNRSVSFEGTPDSNCKLVWSCWCYVCDTPGLPPLTRPQAMGCSDAGMLHVLDIFLAKIFILNPQDGEYLGMYGSYGPGVGEFKTPTSLLVEPGRVLVVDGGKNTIEVLALP